MLLQYGLTEPNAANAAFTGPDLIEWASQQATLIVAVLVLMLLQSFPRDHLFAQPLYRSVPTALIAVHMHFSREQATTLNATKTRVVSCGLDKNTQFWAYLGIIGAIALA